MAKFNWYDRTKERSSTTGTGTYSLDGGAAGGFVAFDANHSSGDTVLYCATDGTDWEVGIGTFTVATPDTLSRDTVLESTNANSAVNWGSGNKDIFTTIPSAFMNHISLGFSAALGAADFADASGSNAIAIGKGAAAAGSGGIAMSWAASAGGSHGVALGQAAVASGADSIAIGWSADATATHAIALGQGAQATVSDTVAIGEGANASATGAVAIADSAAASGTSSVSIGQDSVASATTATAVGWSAEATTTDATAIGVNAHATATGQIALGRANPNKNATGQWAFMAGNGVEAHGDYSQCLGHDFVNNLAGTAAYGIATDAGHYMAIPEADTTDGTATEMTLHGATGIVVKPSSTWAVKGIIAARQTGGTAGAVGDSAMFEVDALITRDGAGNTTLVGETSAAATHKAAAFGGSVAIAADDTNDTLDITVTGELDKTIHWVGKLDIVEAG